MEEESAREIEARIRAGEWVAPSEVAKVLGLSKSTVIRRIDAGVLNTVSDPVSNYMKCDPKDVLDYLEKSRKERRDDSDA